MKLELIQSVNPVTPTKGTNAGKQMYVINGEHWSRTEPKPNDTHVCLEEVEGTGAYAGKKFMNVVGFSADTRQTIGEKIKTLTSHDASYSMAIATLLK